MTTSWHSYPSLFALGHRYIEDLLLDPVQVEEKVDGSQLSFGRFEDENGVKYLKMKSKGADLNIIAPDGMFKKAVDYVKSIQDQLEVGWTYRGEYLAKPKHNSLAYERTPKNNIIIFDINTGHETYLTYAQKVHEANRIGLETVPGFFYGAIVNMQQFRDLLEHVSILGGQKIEGVVIKNYHRFGQDKKILMGKFVSEAFKEVHTREWKASNPNKLDVVGALIQTLKTPARWAKALQHLKEGGQIDDSPKDIGLLFKEVPADVKKEEEEFIKTKLFEWAWPHIQRGVTAGIPEWYKEELLKKQFESPVA